MNQILSIPARVALLVGFAWLATASNAGAQAHKGKHHGGASKAKAPASAPSKPMTAAKPQTPTVQPHKEPVHRVQTPPLSTEELLSNLQSSMDRLRQANFEYRGRRVQAIRQVDAAIRLLNPSAGAEAPTTKAEPVLEEFKFELSAPPGQTARTRSDAQLAEAQKLLRAIESRMPGDGINVHEYKQAKESIQKAVRELNLALVDR